MRVIIFGATGSIGRHLVTRAVASGHTVTVFVRDPVRLDSVAENLEIRQGDVLNYPLVERAVSGHDAVLSSLGTSVTTRNTVRSDGTRNIVTAMEKTDVNRLVCVSTIGVGDSKELLPFHYRYILVPLLLRQAFADHELQESYVMQSSTMWTIVRPGGYTNGSDDSSYRHGVGFPEKPIKATIPRASVADFIVKQLSDNTYVHRTPWVSR